MVMSELDLIDLTTRLDLSRTDYRNKGHAIRYHANSFAALRVQVASNTPR
jgi:hypothetical protein